MSEEDRQSLQSTGLKIPIAVLGDTRFDQVIARLQQPKIIKANLQPQGLTLISGSTWPEDEKVLLKALAPLIKEGKLNLVLVPHEPTESHIAQLKNNLMDLGLTCELYSSATAASPVLIVDQVGILAELYQWGQIAFVGGSFRKTVHSVMEPLAAGLITLVGPYYLNNREAIRFMDKPLDGSGDVTSVMECRDASQLEAQLRRLTSGHAELDKWQKQIRALIETEVGASKKLITALA